MIKNNYGVVINGFDWSGSYSFDAVGDYDSLDIFKFILDEFKDKIPAPVCEGEYSQLRLNIPKQIVHEVCRCVLSSETVTDIDTVSNLHKKAVYKDSVKGVVYCNNVRFELCTYDHEDLPGGPFDITLSFEH